jgi:uncharacterized membrane protein YjgN (DUF898 family)
MNTIAQGAWPPATPVRTASDAGTHPHERPLTIRFTGSGSEYFRIWIVNLLLSIVTLSLYRPWAKVRRLRYFYANTLVADHALDFHGNPLKMLRGYLLVGAMLLAYSVGARVSPLAALVAFGALCVLWPALWRASMQFRLANTSWRGLRFRFAGDLGGAYRTLLPLFVPGLVLVAMGLFIDDPQHPPAWYFKGLALVVLAGIALVPLAFWNMKRYQHDHYGLGQWQTRLTTGPGSFYALTLKVIGLFVLTAIVVFIVAVVIGAVVGFAFKGMFSEPSNRVVLAALTGLLGGIVWLLTLLVPLPYATSRTQNLVWSHTQADALRFESRLEFKALFGLTFRNWLLMLLTLGLYWPFAAVALYRIRVEAITPHLSGDLDALHASARARGDDASGDAAGDLFGIDIGL